MNKKIKETIKLSMPSKAEYVSMVRLTAASITNKMGFNVEEIEDIKVAVAEACTNAITHGLCEEKNNFSVDFEIEDQKIIITVYDNGKGCQAEEIKKPDVNEYKERGLGVFIIKSLMDEVEIISNTGEGTIIKMTKYLGEVSR